MYPLSLIILILWTIYILFTIAVLEWSVHQPMLVPNWIKPSQMITIFAQCHTAVTSIYLGRLAISALHDPDLVPKTWAELFWIANQNWQGPIGVAQTLAGMLRLQQPISFPFRLFAVTSLFSLLTPAALDRAYPRYFGIQTYNTNIPVQIWGRGDMNAMITGPQLAVGAGSWITGERADVMYSNQISFSKDSIDGRFITAPIGQRYGDTARLPGLFEKGDCSDLTEESSRQSALAPPKPPSSSNDMSAWCSEHGLSAQFEKHELNLGGNKSLSMTWCTGFNATTLAKDWMDRPEGHTTTVVAWVNATSGLNTTEGYINCTSTTRTGNANVEQQSSLGSPSFISTFFRFSSLLDKNTPLDQTPFLPPLYAAFISLNQRFEPSTQALISADHSASLMRMLGYREDFIDASYRNTTYMAPTLSRLASQLEDGTLHMAVAVQNVGARTRTFATTSRDYDDRIPGAFARSLKWACITLVLLVVWMALLLYGTARMYRPTFGSSLDSYAAARLLVDKPHLVDGFCVGAPSDNPQLRATFERVGDMNPNEDVGRITSGGRGELQKNRGYGVRGVWAESQELAHISSRRT
jgi:hypothetical protein